MPHGTLTPLGKQWRLVLANLGRSSRPSTTRHAASLTLEAQTCHHDQHEHPPASATERASVRRRVVTIEDTGRPWITRRQAPAKLSTEENLHATLSSWATDHRPASRVNLGWGGVGEETSVGGTGNGTGSYVLNTKPHLPDNDDQSLRRFGRALADETSSKTDVKPMQESDGGKVDQPQLYRLKEADVAILYSRGYTREDVQAWSSIIADHDTASAASSFAATYTTPSATEAPLLILRYLVRRRCISASALHRLVDSTQHLLSMRRPSVKTTSSVTKASDVFILFVWLVRHARKVCPSALESIAELLLHGINAAYTARNVTQLQRMTFLLNRAMLLISHPTAVQPFRDALYQESAIVAILRYMAHHHPPIQLTREGYRAVARVRLCLPKTKSERKWAELKALSWPPWKQDRTAIDAQITPEHGISRAGNTLSRMQEAGYPPRAWERAARIYAGWDMDGTPTIQTLAIVRAGSTGHVGAPEVWAARIQCTRTAQEAWAAYLAYESTTNHPNPIVVRSIFSILHREERRQQREQLGNRHSETRRSAFKRGVLPGDYKELAPPPPSTHLHTYTQKPVPTTLDFYRQLRERGVKISDRTLADLVSNSNSVQLGLRYLEESPMGPAIRRMLTFSGDIDAWEIPPVVFLAIIQLLCRFTYTNIYDAGRRHCLGMALELLERHKSPSHNTWSARPAWIAVLRGIAQSLMSPKLGQRSASLLHNAPAAQQNGSELASDAIALHGYLRRTLSTMQELSFDLDVRGFWYFCIGLENTAVAGWQVLLADRKINGFLANARIHHVQSDTHALSEILSSHADIDRLKSCFRLLIGVSSDTSKFETTPLRPLGIVTNAVLHAYIRALGWLADYEGVLEAIKCVVRYREVTAKQQTHEINRKEMMRRIIISTRVFLERSWLDLGSQGRVEDTYGVMEAQDDRRQRVLQRLETPAPRELVQEVRKLVESVSEWGGWADDEEVRQYSCDGRFERIGLLSRYGGTVTFGQL